MPEITIIIPHRNTPDLLQRCLNSIPDDPIFQVIVVDDNSNSEMLEHDIFIKHGRLNTTFLFTKEGRGAGYARNKGLDIAVGKWVLFADSDDYFVDNMLSMIKKYLNSSSEMILFKASSVHSDTLLPSNRNENINSRIDDALNKLITTKQASISVQSPWCRMIKRDLIEKFSIRFEEVISSNDTMFTTMCTCLCNDISLSNEILYVVTYRSGSLWDTRRYDPLNLMTRLEVQIRRNKYVRAYGYDQLPVIGLVYKSRIFGFRIFLKALWLALRTNSLFTGLGVYFRKLI